MANPPGQRPTGFVPSASAPGRTETVVSPVPRRPHRTQSTSKAVASSGVSQQIAPNRSADTLRSCRHQHRCRVAVVSHSLVVPPVVDNVGRVPSGVLPFVGAARFGQHRRRGLAGAAVTRDHAVLVAIVERRGRVDLAHVDVRCGTDCGHVRRHQSSPPQFGQTMCGMPPGVVVRLSRLPQLPHHFMRRPPDRRRGTAGGSKTERRQSVTVRYRRQRRPAHQRARRVAGQHSHDRSSPASPRRSRPRGPNRTHSRCCFQNAIRRRSCREFPRCVARFACSNRGTYAGRVSSTSRASDQSQSANRVS